VPHLRNAPEKIDEYWETRGNHTKVYKAYRDCNKIHSEMKYTAIHSRLVDVTAANYFYPSDGTDGTGELNRRTQDGFKLFSLNPLLWLSPV